MKKCVNCGKEIPDVYKVCNYCNKTQPDVPAYQTRSYPVPRNVIATIFKIIGIVTFVGGFIMGIILGKDYSGDFVFATALIYWASAFISGVFFLGFGEIISLLNELCYKQNNN